MCALASFIKNVPGAGFPDADLPDITSADTAGTCIVASVAENTRPKRRPSSARVVQKGARIRCGKNSAASAMIDIKMLPVMAAVDEMIVGNVAMTTFVLAGEIARTIVDRMNDGETLENMTVFPVSRCDHRVDMLEEVKKVGLPG